jgi:hypothetical protein
VSAVLLLKFKWTKCKSKYLKKNTWWVVYNESSNPGGHKFQQNT